jgi:hypothetical protein
MITYVLYCYPKNKKAKSVVEIVETFGADYTPYVQNKLVHKALDNGFFVKEVKLVKGENAS